MAKDKALDDIAPVWTAINQYMEARDMVLTLIINGRKQYQQTVESMQKAD